MSTPIPDVAAEATESEQAPVDSSPSTAPAKQAVVDNLVSEVTTKQDEKRQKEELVARQAEAEESIRKKEFFVPIGQVSRRRTTRILTSLVIFILIMGLLGLNFAIDAGMLDIGVQPLTDLL